MSSIADGAGKKEEQQTTEAGCTNGVTNEDEGIALEGGIKPEGGKILENGINEGGGTGAEGKTNAAAAAGGAEIVKLEASSPKIQIETGKADGSQTEATKTAEVTKKRKRTTQRQQGTQNRRRKNLQVWINSLRTLKPLEAPVFVGDSTNAEMVKSLNQAVTSAVSSLAGGKARKGSADWNAADLAPQDWDKLFKMTGLYQVKVLKTSQLCFESCSRDSGYGL